MLKCLQKPDGLDIRQGICTNLVPVKIKVTITIINKFKWDLSILFGSNVRRLPNRLSVQTPGALTCCKPEREINIYHLLEKVA